MVDRSITVPRTRQRVSESVDSGPSPFPLLVLVLIITAILFLRPQQEPNLKLFGISLSFPAQNSPAPTAAGSI